MKTAAMPMAVKPARRAATRSPAPAAMPTRTVAANPMPKGTTKVMDGMVMAIWCAAKCGEAQGAHRQRRAVEQRHLEHHGDADGKTQLEQLEEGVPMRTNQPLEDVIALERRETPARCPASRQS